MPRVTRRRTLLIAAETTPGTAMALTAANALSVFTPLVQFDTQVDDRDPTGTLGPIASVPGARGAKVSLQVELTGGPSGAVEPPWASLLLPACGMTNTSSHTYTPTSNPALYKTLTVAVVEQGPAGGTAKFASGVMGSFKLSGENGKRIMLDFEGSGCWVNPADQAFPALPALPPIPPRLASCAMTIGAYTPYWSRFTFDLGATVTRLPDVTSVSGYRYALVTNRRAKGTFDLDADTVANFNLYQQQLAMTQSAFSLAVPTTAGGTITIAAPAFQFLNSTEGDRSGLTTENIDFQFNQVNGDDEFSITFA